jgi:hypothetical protein
VTGSAFTPATATTGLLTTCRDVLQLEVTRRLATREGWRYQHVQAIIVAIHQYAEAATANRDFFTARSK